NDPALQNQSWASSQGIATIQRDSSVSPNSALRARRPLAHALGLGDPSADFTLDNLTPGHGLSIYDSTLVFTPDSNDPGAGSISIDVMNSFLRSLWAYVAFFDASDQPIGGWNDVGLVSPVNVVLGIPVDTDPTTLNFDWPAAASRATLAHGGFGTSNWDSELVWKGIMLTGVFNYGIPFLFLAIGSELDSNAVLKSIEKDYPTIVAVFKAAASIIGNVGSNIVCMPNIKSLLSGFADGVAGLLVHAGLEKLQTYVLAEMTEAELEDAIPYVSFIFQIANRAVDLVEVGETTVEILTSPAVYSVGILRSMPVGVSVRPDPTHGSLGNPAIWPLDSDHYECVLQYTGATSYTDSGPMLGVNSSEPISITYASVPEGGTCQVQFSVYAADDTLLGRWTSAWVPAQRPQPNSQLNFAGAIQEMLVPLTSSTIYIYKEKLVYSAATSSHCWQGNQFALPASVVTDLDNQQVDSTTTAAFAANATPLDSSASVTVITEAEAWEIVDGASRYALTLSAAGGREVVVNTNNAPLEVLPLNSSDLGNNLGATVGLTINNRAYMLGYCWMASGQDVPAAGTESPIITSQINTFQNINVLANPEASLKFTGVGFSNEPFIVYDQFGPAPLFSVDASYVSDLNQGTVSASLANLFSEFSYTLPTSGVAVGTVTPSVQWTLTINSLPTYTLLAGGGQIDIYPYPAVVVSSNNFYLEPTSSDPTNYGYQVRSIVLDNTTPFDMTQTQSWGQFMLPHLNDAVVHPQGYLIGAHFNLDTLEILRLAAVPTADADAQPAVTVGGSGTRPGLFSGPAALAVTIEGRILVLEQGNQRIQAIDVNGNPIPCFANGAVCTLDPSCAASLDNGLVSVDLRAAFSAAGYPLSSIWQVRDSTNLYKLIASDTEVLVTFASNSLYSGWSVADSSTTPQEFSLTLSDTAIAVTQAGTTLFTVATSAAVSLNAGALGDLLSAAFVSAGITFVSPIQVTGSDPLTLDLSVVTDLTEGNVPASLGTGLATRNMTLGSPAAVLASNTVAVIQATQNWILTDQYQNATYQLLTSADGSFISVTLLASTMALQPSAPGQTLTYLSVSTEAKGYIYVLSYQQPGDEVDDFLLDIYQPDGSYLVTTAGLNAGDITVDMWRNLYSLNFESFLGPGGRTEPSISIWTPSV
ncbi:MAG TPA: hypothetical protein VN776_02870, partial [Terracidiphilus sp.]|nr:hypothetical protein [Terracidiphilus sp.]